MAVTKVQGESEADGLLSWEPPPLVARGRARGAQKSLVSFPTSCLLGAVRAVVRPLQPGPKKKSRPGNLQPQGTADMLAEVLFLFDNGLSSLRLEDLRLPPEASCMSLRVLVCSVPIPGSRLCSDGWGAVASP